MRAATIRAVVAAVLGASLHFPAAAIEYSGNLGLRYDRIDVWDPVGPRVTSATTELDGRLDAAGFVLAPSIFRWSGGVNYDRVRTGWESSTSASDGLGYHLGFRLFESRGSKLQFAGDASRATVDQTDSSSSAPMTGTTKDETYVLRTAVSSDNRPSLTLTGMRRDATNSGFARPTTTETTNQLNATLQHGTGPYYYVLDYLGTWTENSLAAGNFVQQQVSLGAGADVGKNVSAFTTSRYVLRTPRTYDALNPRTELTAVSLGARWLADGVSGSTSYAYGHTILSAPATAEQEEISHSLTTLAERSFSPRWTGTAQTVLNLNRLRVGTGEEIDAGETARVTARWSRPATETESAWMVEAGPSFGAVEPRTGATEIGYGGLARASWGSPDRPASLQYSAAYEIEYSNNLYARRGWTLVQHASGRLLAPLAHEVHLTGLLAAGAQRQTMPLLGDRASRNLLLEGTVAWRRYVASLALSAGDGLNGALAQSVAGDGLFYPEKYDSHSRAAQARVSLPLPGRITFTGRAAYTVLSGPLTPDQRQASVWGALAYSIGLIQLSIEDRYAVGGTTALDNKSNLVLFRISRSLSGGF